jgi:hypothetical protein
MKPWKLLASLSIGMIVAAVAGPPLLGHVPRRSLISGQVVIAKWAQPLSISWSMNPTQTPNITGTASAESVFRQAFRTWGAVPTATIAFAEGPMTATGKPGLDQVNLITANLTAAEWAAYGIDAISFTNVTTSLATGQLVDADIMFNPSAGFSTSTPTPLNLSDLEAVATHEVGHLLGLDHSPLASAIMFPLAAGRTFSRTLTADDMIGVSTLYPTAAFASRGSIDGTVRTMSNVGVFGAIVVVVGQNGQPLVATITAPDGKYSITGLPAGNYTLYAEPMDGPFGENDPVAPLSMLYPGKNVDTNFTSRFR